MSKQVVQVPDLGGAESVEVIEICLAAGADVAVDDALIVVESDKASMDIPSPCAGKLVNWLVKEGDTVSEGDPIAEVELSAEAEKEAVETPVETKAPSTDSEPKPPQAQLATESSSAPAGGNMMSVSVPDLGGADAVTIIELPVAVGDTVAEGDALAVMESDKASMDLPSPYAGEVIALHIAMDDQVSEGQLVAEIKASSPVNEVAKATTGSAVSAAAPAVSTPVGKAAAPTHSVEKTASAAASLPRDALQGERRRRTDIYAGPAVRKLARELGVDLSLVDGQGPRGRILKDDIHAFVKKALQEPGSSGAAIPRVPEIDFAQFGEVDIQAMSKLHKLTAANMHRSWLNVPHVTQFDDADITDLEDFRRSMKAEMEKRGNKISPLPFILKAVAFALRDNPAFNASLGSDGETIVYKQYVHIGVAVDTPAGLMVPVIRDVDKKGIWDIAEEVAMYAGKAKNRQLKPLDMQGGCFTVSSLGGIGGAGFTPIVNTPEVGILGVSKLAIKPVFIDGEFVPRKMLPLSLSYDHRAVNGGDAGRFLTQLVGLLGDVRKLLM